MKAYTCRIWLNRRADKYAGVITVADNLDTAEKATLCYQAIRETVKELATITGQSELTTAETIKAMLTDEFI